MKKLGLGLLIASYLYAFPVFEFEILDVTQIAEISNTSINLVPQNDFVFSDFEIEKSFNFDNEEANEKIELDKDIKFLVGF